MSQPSGYQDSPDTVDDGGGSTADETGEHKPPLTTDDEAQRDDSVARPGNEPD
jgi:hypothetical protein